MLRKFSYSELFMNSSGHIETHNKINSRDYANTNDRRPRQHQGQVNMP